MRDPPSLRRVKRPHAVVRDASGHETQGTRSSREKARDDRLPRPPPALAPPGASRSRHNRHSYRPAGRGMQQRRPAIRRVRWFTGGGRLSEFVVRARLLAMCTRPRGAELPRPRQQRAALEGSCYRRVARGQRFPGQGGHGSLREPEPRRAGKPHSHGPGAAGLPEGSRLHALTRHHQLPRPDLSGWASQSPNPLQHRYHVKAVRPGCADLHETHPGRTPAQQRIRWLKTMWAGWLKAMAGSAVGDGS
jgi:hypothetical protein